LKGLVLVERAPGVAASDTKLYAGEPCLVLNCMRTDGTGHCKMGSVSSGVHEGVEAIKARITAKEASNRSQESGEPGHRSQETHFSGHRSQDTHFSDGSQRSQEARGTQNTHFSEKPVEAREARKGSQDTHFSDGSQRGEKQGHPLFCRGKRSQDTRFYQKKPGHPLFRWKPERREARTPTFL